MSYTDIFGGATVSPSYLNYTSFSLTALNSPLELALPLAFQNTNPVIAQIVDLTASTTGLSIVLPDMTQTSVGWSVLFDNVGSNSITIYANDGVTSVTSIAASTAIYLYLTANSVANGTFRSIPWGGGTPSITNINATSSSPDLVIGGVPITTSGTITFALAQDLLSLTSFGSGVGIGVRTAANTWALRTLTGTGNQITVANGTGVSGNPTLALASAISGINSIIAGNVRIGYTGTNVIDTADSNPLQISGTLSLTPLAGAASSLRWYDNAGTNYLAFKAPSSLAGNVLWTLPPTDGASGAVLSTDGTGTLSWASSGSGTVTSVSGVAHRITSTGGANPIIDIAADYVGQTSITMLGTVNAGTWQGTPVAVGYGGTGAASFTAYGVVIGGTTTTNPLQSIATGTAGQILVSAGAGAPPVFTTVSTGTNWINQTTSITMTAGNGYIANNVGLVTLTIPATAALGAEFSIAGLGSGGWLLQANTGQTISIGVDSSTSAGSLASTNANDSIKVVCVVANTTFKTIASEGNITVA